MTNHEKRYLDTVVGGYFKGVCIDLGTAGACVAHFFSGDTQNAVKAEGFRFVARAVEEG